MKRPSLIDAALALSRSWLAPTGSIREPEAESVHRQEGQNPDTSGNDRPSPAPSQSDDSGTEQDMDD